MRKLKKKEIFFLILCVLIGFVLRFYSFDRKSLWVDEIYTFNDSRDDLTNQIGFYKDNPTFPHPPLFFILTHFFHPFTKPERELRIIPLIFGTLSIPIFYFLSRSFCPKIAAPCTLSLVFMAYHISLSQDGRSYSFLMFIGMMGLYFFIKHLQTSRKGYLFLVGLLFSVLFYTSYSSIPFITLSQILWLYRTGEDNRKPTISSFLLLNGTVLFFCMPWVIFVALHYKGQPMVDLFHNETPDSIWSIIYSIFHDWVPHVPLMIVSVVLLILFPLFLKNWKNAIVLLALLILPIVGLYAFCNLFNVTHFVTSRYFMNFLPPFLISIYLSVNAVDEKVEKLKGFMRLKVLFVVLFIASNLLILPLYYRSEKQDFRGLTNYLKGQIRDGDTIMVGTLAYFPGILHYFGVYPEGRHYLYSSRKVSEKEIEYRLSLKNQEKEFVICYSKTFWVQYALEGHRLWLVVDKMVGKRIRMNTPSVFKGYFDGSVSNFERFPVDASLYLFLWDSKSPEEMAIDMPLE